jgi:hypothetical protein
MADNKMGNDLKRNVGGQGNKDAGQHSPGRNPEDDQSTGQRSDKGSERQGDAGSGGRGGRQGDDDR